MVSIHQDDEMVNVEFMTYECEKKYSSEIRIVIIFKYILI